MNSIVDTSMTPLQELVKTKLHLANHKIIMDVVSSIIASQSMTPEVFIHKFVIVKEGPLFGVDERVNRFFQKVVASADLGLNAPVLTQGFLMLEAYTKDSTIRQKIVESIAYPTVVALVAELDALKPTIIADIVS